MKESVNKGFLFYVGIFLVIVAALVLASGAIMIMSPGVKILGYEYINSKNTMTIETYDGKDKLSSTSSTLNYVNALGEVVEKMENGSYVEFSKLNKLVIKTNGMGVSLRYGGEENKISIIRDVNGFSKEDTVQKLVATKSFLDGVFTITAFETTPKLTLSNNSAIIVYFKQHDLSNLNIEIETSTAGLSVAASSKNYSTEKHLTFNSINFKTKKGNMLLSADADIKNSILVDSQESSEINVRKNQELSGVFKATMKSGRLNIANLTASSMEVTGENLRMTGKVLKFEEEKGLDLRVKKGDLILTEVLGYVKDVNSLAENLLVKIEKVSGDFIMDKINIKEANTADVTVGEVRGETLIKTSSGNVSVRGAYNIATIETTSGTITLKNGAIEDDSGDISDAWYSIAQFNVKSGSGNILVDATSVVKENEIISDSGNISLNYSNTRDSFEIDATSERKNAITFNPEEKTYSENNVKGYPTPQDKEESFEDKITIKTKGRITISAVKFKK